MCVVRQAGARAIRVRCRRPGEPPNRRCRNQQRYDRLLHGHHDFQSVTVPSPNLPATFRSCSGSPPLIVPPPSMNGLSRLHHQTAALGNRIDPAPVEQLGDYGVFVVCVMPPPPLLGPPPPLCGSPPELGSAGKCTPPGAGAVVGAGDGLGIGAAATGPIPNSSVDVATPAAIEAALATRFKFIRMVRSPRTRGGVILVTCQAGPTRPSRRRTIVGPP
jgi:hypothetical protein